MLRAFFRDDGQVTDLSAIIGDKILQIVLEVCSNLC